MLRKLLQPMRSHHTRGVVALLALTVSYRSSVRAVRLYVWHCMSESSLGCAIVLLRVAEQHLGFLSLFMDLRQSILILARLPLKYLARFHARSSQSRIASHHSQSKSRYLGRMPNSRTSDGLRRFP